MRSPLSLFVLAPWCLSQPVSAQASKSIPADTAGGNVPGAWTRLATLPMSERAPHRASEQLTGGELPGRVLILASVDMFKTVFLNQRNDSGENALFLVDAVRCLARGRHLDATRRSGPTVEYLRKEDEKADSGVTPLGEGTRSILRTIPGVLSITYYVSPELPPFLEDVRLETRRLLEEFQKASEGRVRCYFVDPEAEAEPWVKAKTHEYLAAREEFEKSGDEAKRPREPRRSTTDIQQLFSGMKQTDEEIRKDREARAKGTALRSGRKKEEVEREYLHDAWLASYVSELNARGIAAVPVSQQLGQRTMQIRIYNAIELTCPGKAPEILGFFISAEGLEQELARRISKLRSSANPVIAFFDGRKPKTSRLNPLTPLPPSEADYAGIIEVLGARGFDVRQIALEEGDSIDDLVQALRVESERNGKVDAAAGEEPATQGKEVAAADLRRIDCLIVAQPHALHPRQVYEINRAVSLGVPTLFFVSPFSVDLSAEGMRMGLPFTQNSLTGLNSVFLSWGIEVGTKMLASNDCGRLSPLPRQEGATALPPNELPLIVAAGRACLRLPSHHFNEKIGLLLFPATSGIRLRPEVLESNGVEAKDCVLAWTSKETWSFDVGFPTNRKNPFEHRHPVELALLQIRDAVLPKNPQDFEDFVEPLPLAIILTGKMPFHFDGQPIPAWSD